MDTMTFKKPAVTLGIQVHSAGFSNFSNEMETMMILADAVLKYIKTIPKGHRAYKFVKDCTFKDVANWLARTPKIAFFYQEGKLVGALGFAIDVEPFSQHACIHECFVLSLDKGFHGFGYIAYEYLQFLAAAHSARFIIAGTAWSVSNCSDNFYGKKAFTQQNIYVFEKKGG